MNTQTIGNYKESDLYPPVRSYLETLGYSVNGEIMSCDILANKEDEWLVVELKKTLNLEVILQAAERQKISDTVYIAVFKPKQFSKSSKYKRICHLLRRLEIGLFLVSFKGSEHKVEVVQTAERFDRVQSQRVNAKKRSQIQNEFKKRKTKTTGGITKTKIMTAYREDAVRIGELLEISGPSKPAQLRETGLELKRIQTILYKDYYGWFNRVETGIYQVSEQWSVFKSNS